MIRLSVRSVTAALLVALLGTLNTGMPSHSHETDRPETQGYTAISADAHSHGVMLLGAAERERVPSTSTQVPAIAVGIDAALVAASERRLQTLHAAPLRPSERGPPPSAPRAPPQLI
jgi:hypothetical protein